MSGTAELTQLDLRIVAKEEGIDIVVGNHAIYVLYQAEHEAFQAYAALVAEQLEAVGIGNGMTSARIAGAMLSAFVRRAEEVNTTNVGNGVCWSIPWNIVGYLISLAAQSPIDYPGLVTELDGEMVDSLRAWKPVTSL